MPRQARWMEFLEEFDFELEHIPASQNTVADLSRRIDYNRGVEINNSVQILSDHLFVRTVRENHLFVSAAQKQYLEEDDETRRKILREVHDTPVGGHPGISNTWHLIK